MGIRRYPGNVHRGNYSVTGAFRVDASAYVTGPLYGATGLIVIADSSFGGRLDCATGIDACGNIVSATALTVCGSAQ